MPFAHRLQQSRHASRAGGPQLERIRPRVGQAAEHDVDLLQGRPSVRSQTRAAASDEISAARQVIAEVRGEVRGLDEAGALRVGTEQDGPWAGDRLAVRRPSRRSADRRTSPTTG